MPQITQGIYNVLALSPPLPVERRNLVFFLAFIMIAFTSWLWLFAGASTAGLVKLRDGSSSEPIAVTKNGSYAGVYDGVYKQDYFLGVPYALPPTGERRFKVPTSLNGTWTGTRDAKSYSKECVGYGVRTHSLHFQLEVWKRVRGCMLISIHHRAINGLTKPPRIVSTSTSFDHPATKTRNYPSPSGSMVVDTGKVVVLISATIYLSSCRILSRLVNRLLVLVSIIDLVLGGFCIRGR